MCLYVNLRTYKFVFIHTCLCWLKGPTHLLVMCLYVNLRTYKVVFIHQCLCWLKGPTHLLVMCLYVNLCTYKSVFIHKCLCWLKGSPHLLVMCLYVNLRTYKVVFIHECFCWLKGSPHLLVMWHLQNCDHTYMLPKYEECNMCSMLHICRDKTFKSKLPLWYRGLFFVCKILIHIILLLFISDVYMYVNAKL